MRITFESALMLFIKNKQNLYTLVEITAYQIWHVFQTVYINAATRSNLPAALVAAFSPAEHDQFAEQFHRAVALAPGNKPQPVNSSALTVVVHLV